MVLGLPIEGVKSGAEGGGARASAVNLWLVVL